MKKLTLLIVSSLFIANLIAQATLPFADNFNSGSFNSNWWSPMPNLNGVSGLVSVENNVGVNNSFGVRIGKTVDGMFTTNALDLHLDLSGESDVEMTFWITDVNDETQNEDGIYFSDDGGINFVKVLDFFPEEWCNGTYGQHPPLDVDGLATDANLDLTNQFIIRFQQIGQYDFTGGTNNQDGILLDDINVYNPNLEYATLPFEDDFDTGVMKNAWAWNFADATSSIVTGNAITNPMSFVGVSNQTGLNNTPGVLFGKICDGTFTTNALDLHLNLLGETDVEMTFWIADANDETQVDDGIYFSDDGGVSFSKVLDFFPDEWCDGTYGQHPPLDVDGLAIAAGLELTNQFVIRFQQTGKDNFTGGTNNQDGFYLDNVNVYDPNLVYANLPFEDDFNTGIMKDAWAWNFADATSSIVTGNAITNPMSFVGVSSQTGLNNTPGVLLGRICDGTFTTNALDLHLNLSGETDVELTFWIADANDETQVDDGIYFSDNGGVDFVKVLDFFPDEWCDGVYGQHPPLDVDGLAEEADLQLTNQFVIRFQQTGRDNFTGGTNNQDGFYLDNVSIYDPNLLYAELPFEDDFEEGILNSSWAWNFADETSTIVSDDAITNPMSFVGVVDAFGYDNSTYSTWIGRICDGTFTTNALDLHLNLLNQIDIELTFWLAHNNDETQDDDGIYLSNDGGVSFVKVYDFDFSSTPNGVYEFYQLDISNLASGNSMSLTDFTVIRFQQRGKDNFNGGTNNQDGIYLDNVNVTAMVSSVDFAEIENNIQVYPNPVKSQINIMVGELGYKISRIEISNGNGMSIYSKEISQKADNYQIDISNLLSGFYVVTIITEEGVKINKKIIK